MTNEEKRVIGWREWLAIPTLGIERIKAKIDTGARTSALHAYDLEPFQQDGVPWIRFTVRPLQRNSKLVFACTAPVVDQREVTSSTGQTERRYVVEVEIAMGGETWPVEMTLAARDEMGFRMLLGRTAVEGRMIVDPDRSFVLGRLKPPKTPQGKKRPGAKTKKGRRERSEDREATP